MCVKDNIDNRKAKMAGKTAKHYNYPLSIVVFLLMLLPY